MSTDAGSEPSSHRHFDFGAMPAAEIYRLMTATIAPRPIAWVTTVARDGTRNAAPFSFFNMFGADPPVVGLGVLARPGPLKDTAANIAATFEFVVNLVPFALAEAMNLTAVEAPPEVDELALAGLATAPSLTVRPPRIAASPVSFECRLQRAIETGPQQWLFIGDVLHAHLAEAILEGPPERPRVNVAALDPIARMPGPTAYCRAEKSIFHLTRPDWRALAEGQNGKPST